ncbi:MAG TPA: PAS domain-containing protein, partial [Methylococcales bacterium]
VDENGMFSVVNPSFMQIFGLDNELDILNVNCQDWSRWEVYGEDSKLLHVDDHPVRKAAMTGKPVKNQFVGLRNPGANELIYLLISAEPVLREDSDIYRVICTYHDITERKDAEEKLERSNQKINEILSSIQDDIYVLDRDWNFVYASKLFTSRIGKEPKDFVGNNIWKMFPKHIGTVYEENLRAVMDKGEMRRFEIGGKYTDAYYRMAIFPSAEGITVLGTDITKQQKAEESLQKSEEQYRILFSTMNEGFCIIEMLFDEHEKPIDYVFVEANPAFEGQTGLKNATGKRMRELAPEHEEHWFEIYGKVAFTGEPVRFENRAEALHRWYEVYAYRVGLPESRKVAIIFNDITERKQLEEQTRLRAEELATVMETTPVAIWVSHDPQSKSITGNRMANDFYEAEEGENVSANVTPIRRFFHKGHELTADELPMQEAALNDIDIRSVELDVLLQSGKWRFMLGSASPLHDADGSVRGSVGAFIDITERKLAEQEREIMVAFLQLMNDSKGTEVLVHSAIRFFRERSGFEAIG